MNSTKEKIKFALRKITTDQFAILNDNFKEKEKIELVTNIKFGINKESRVIVVIMRFQFEQKSNPFMILEASCHFIFEKNAWDSFINKETDEVILRKNLVLHLTALTIGTARGVLHGKTEGTVFNKYFLPTLNVNDLIKKDVILK